MDEATQGVIGGGNFGKELGHRRDIGHIDLGHGDRRPFCAQFSEQRLLFRALHAAPPGQDDLLGPLFNQPAGAMQPQTTQAAGDEIAAGRLNHQCVGGNRSSRHKAGHIPFALAIGDLLFASGRGLQQFSQ